MKIKWWHIVALMAIYAFCGRDLAIILTLIYGITFFAKNLSQKNKWIYGSAITKADIQDLDNEIYEIEAIIDQVNKVNEINDELNEIEAVLVQLSETERPDRKVIPIWDIRKKP